MDPQQKTDRPPEQIVREVCSSIPRYATKDGLFLLSVAWCEGLRGKEVCKILTAKTLFLKLGPPFGIWMRFFLYYPSFTVFDIWRKQNFCLLHDVNRKEMDKSLEHIVKKVCGSVPVFANKVLQLFLPCLMTQTEHKCMLELSHWILLMSHHVNQA